LSIHEDNEKEQGTNKTGSQQVMDSQFHLDHKKHKGNTFGMALESTNWI